jgi:hypothetical protein
VDQRQWEHRAGKDEAGFERHHRSTCVQQRTAEPHSELGEEA